MELSRLAIDLVRHPGTQRGKCGSERLACAMSGATVRSADCGSPWLGVRLNRMGALHALSAVIGKALDAPVHMTFRWDDPLPTVMLLPVADQASAVDFGSSSVAQGGLAARVRTSMSVASPYLEQSRTFDSLGRTPGACRRSAGCGRLRTGDGLGRVRGSGGGLDGPARADRRTEKIHSSPITGTGTGAVII